MARRTTDYGFHRPRQPLPLMVLLLLCACGDPPYRSASDTNIMEAPLDDPPCDGEEVGFARTRQAVGEEAVFWSRVNVDACIPLTIDPAGGKTLDFATIKDAAFEAARVWEAAASTCGAPLCFRDAGTVSRDIGFARDAQGIAINLVTFAPNAEAWSDAHPPGIIAATTSTVRISTGEVLGADIDFNEPEYRFTDQETIPTGAFDLRAVMIHEMGHLLGFEHNNALESVMYPTEQSGGELNRTLAEMDVAGVCVAFGCY